VAGPACLHPHDAMLQCVAVRRLETWLTLRAYTHQPKHWHMSHGGAFVSFFHVQIWGGVATISRLIEIICLSCKKSPIKETIFCTRDP